MSRVFQLSFALLLGSSCARMQVAPSGDHLPAPVQQCAQTGEGCAKAFEQAALQKDRRAAGQALLGLAHGHPQQEALARIGLWLAQSPWLPQEGPWREAQLQPLWTAPVEQTAPGPLYFEGLSPPRAARRRPCECPS